MSVILKKPRVFPEHRYSEELLKQYETEAIDGVVPISEIDKFAAYLGVRLGALYTLTEECSIMVQEELGMNKFPLQTVDRFERISEIAGQVAESLKNKAIKKK